MNRIGALSIILVLCHSSLGTGGELLRGCRDPQVTLKLIAGMREQWDDLTMAQFSNFWPTELSIDGLSAGGEPVLFVWNGRVIENRRECGERFIFADPAHDPDQHLLSVRVTFSSESQALLITVARQIVSAWDPPDVEQSLHESEWQLDEDGKLSLEYGWGAADGSEAGNISIDIVSRAGVSTLNVDYSRFRFADATER